MKISWNCLNQLINLTDLSYLYVTQQLTLAGFETENLVQHDHIQDITFDLNLTANRNDIVSLIDIALEISTLVQRKLNIDYNIINNSQKYFFNKKIINHHSHFDLFKKFNLSILLNINLHLGQKKINNYLLAYEIQPNNNFLDIIKFINLKWGQRIRIYRINLHTENTINHLQAKIEIKNKIHNLILKNSNNPNDNYIEITDNNIHKFNTFENIALATYEDQKGKESISNTYVLHAYHEIIKLIPDRLQNQPKTQNYTIYMYDNQQDTNMYLECQIKSINKTLGPIRVSTDNNKQYLTKDTMIHILNRLQLKTHNKNENLYIKIPPKRQKDITREIDITEELGRIYGFDQFNDYLPRFTNKHSKLNLLSFNNIRIALRSIGLHEVISHGLDKKKENLQIQIINPLNKDQQILRNHLIGNLITSTIQNIYQNDNIFECFEIGKIFNKKPDNKYYKEEMHLAGILGNPNFNHLNWDKDYYQLHWFQAKGQIESFLERIHAHVSWSTRSNNTKLIKSLEAYIHTTRTIYLNNNNKTFGCFSQINNLMAKQLNIGYPIYIFEINLYELLKTIKIKHNTSYQYTFYSNYPKITRDLSLQVHRDTPIEQISQIINTIKNHYFQLLESIVILNEYHNNNHINRKNINLRATYRSKYRTLTNKEVEILDNLFKKRLKYFLHNSQSKT